MTPAPVDHDARRAQLSAALERVAAGSGLDAASVRAVAAEAGVAIGTVQHYFPTKDALLTHARAAVSTALDARVDAALAGVDDPWEAVRAVLLAVLPTDAPSRRIMRVFTEFETRALSAPTLAASSRADDDELHAAFTELLRGAGVHDDPELEARTLIALLRGLCQHLLLHQTTGARDEALAIVDRHLARLARRL